MTALQCTRSTRRLEGEGKNWKVIVIIDTFFNNNFKKVLLVKWLKTYFIFCIFSPLYLSILRIIHPLLVSSRLLLTRKNVQLDDRKCYRKRMQKVDV